MAGCDGILSALLLYGFLCYFCVKHDTFNDHSGRSLLESLDDPFDVILTRNSYTHYANMSVQYTATFHGCKNDNFQMKN